MENRLNWKTDEVIEMLEIVKETNILQPTDGKKYRTVEIFFKVQKELQKKGYLRSAYQIRTKLKSLKQKFIECKKNNTECELFELLEEVFLSRPVVTCKEKNSLKDAKYGKIECRQNWSLEEERQMLEIVQKYNILQHTDGKKYLSVDAFCKVQEELQDRGYLRKPYQIRTKLKSLKQKFIDCLKNNDIPGSVQMECEHFALLEELFLWPQKVNTFSSEEEDSLEATLGNSRKSKTESRKVWRADEVRQMLQIVQEYNLLHITNGRKYRNVNFFSKVQKELQKKGFSRTITQIRTKLKTLKQQNLLNEHFALVEQLVPCPTPTLVCNAPGMENSVEAQMDLRQYWSTDEVEEMLKIVQERNIFHPTNGKKYRSIEDFSEVQKELQKKGYVRTPSQIRIKLKALKQKFFEYKKNNTSDLEWMECDHLELLEEIFSCVPSEKLIAIKVDYVLEGSQDTTNKEKGSSSVSGSSLPPLSPSPPPSPSPSPPLSPSSSLSPSTSSLSSSPSQSPPSKRRKRLTREEKLILEERKWLSTEFEKQRCFEKEMLKDFQKSITKLFQ